MFKAEAVSYFSEYVALRKEIEHLTPVLHYAATKDANEEEITRLQKELDVKVERMKVVLSELKQNDVKMEDLILMSMGVWVDLFE